MKSILGIKAKQKIVHIALVNYMANQRQGTASTKTEGEEEVAGGGRKPWKQKGTGRARQGSLERHNGLKVVVA